MDGEHPYCEDLEQWDEELSNSECDTVHYDEDWLSMNLFMDQDVLDKCVENSKMLNQECNMELNDLIVNMIKDDFAKRYNVNDIINHVWFQ